MVPPARWRHAAGLIVVIAAAYGAKLMGPG